MNQHRVDASSSSLNHLLAKEGLQLLDASTTAKFDEYLALILRWNSRINLTAIRDPEQIRRRHFLESIACAQHLPEGIGTLLDFGSGAGFPGLPIALCRPEVEVTLAESQNKKAAFLQEAVRALELKASVFTRRAELLAQRFDCVTLRAVDQMEKSISAASGLVKTGACTATLTTRERIQAVQKAAGSGFQWREPYLLPGSEQRVLILRVKAALK